MTNLRDTTYKKLLHVFLNEVLKDFQRYIIERFNMPSSLWIFDEDNNLQYLEPKESINKYSDFCKYMISYRDHENKETECVIIEKKRIKQILNDSIKSQEGNNAKIIKCHMGISKILFPIRIGNNIIGGLIVGKYISTVNQDNQIKDMQTKHDIFVNSKIILNKHDVINKNDIIKYINSLPRISEQSIQNILSGLSELIPLLKRLYKYNYPKNHLFDGVLFLEQLESEYRDIILCEEDLWMRVDKSLKAITDKLNLNSSIVYFSSTDNYQDLLIHACYPKGRDFPSNIQFESSRDFQMIAQRNKGLVLTENNKNDYWLNNYIRRLLHSKSAIIYANRVFAGKLVMICFGFKEGKYLTEFQRLLLRESTERIFKQLNNVLSSIEVDHIMADTGHMLRRAIASVEKGFSNVDKYGLKINENDSVPLKRIKTIAPQSITYGLFRLRLIVSNFHAFKTLREFQFGENIHKRDSMKLNIEEFNILKMISDIKDSYNHSFSKHSKTFIIDSKLKELHYMGHKSLFRLMILNIMDNAAKFSYDKTHIDINIKQIDNFYKLSFSNLGVGVAQDEFLMVFERYYQSRYKSKSKRREGSGYGLNICKKYLEIFLPNGSIKLTSRPVWIGRKKQHRKFEGDNFLTVVNLLLPINNK